MAVNYSIALAPNSPQCVFNAIQNRFEQTWTYVVTITGSTQAREISHLEIELCAANIHNVLRTFKNGVQVPVDGTNVEVGAPNGNCLTNPPVVRRIKWDNLSNTDLPNSGSGTFAFVLEGCFQTDTIDASIKGGPECRIYQVQGPNCTLIPPPDPPHRGITLSQFTEDEEVE